MWQDMGELGMIDPSDVTIIVPHLGGSYETETALDECLKSLKETAPGVKIILAINGHGCGVHRTEADLLIKDQGQCKAVNAAVAVANTSWIFVTNDDMIYSPDWLGKLTDGLNLDTVKCISPKLIEPRAGAPTFEVFFAGGAGGDFDKEKWLTFALEYGNRAEVDRRVRTGFNLPFLISKELWDLIGGYDIVYDPWGSNGDSDLEYKIRLAGVQPYQNMNAIVYHFSQTSGTSHPENRPYWDKNWHYFIEKWGFERASSPTIWTADFEIPEDKLKYRPHWVSHYAVT